MANAPAPIKQHAPGVYIGLPMWDYVNDPAISGSGLKKLVNAPGDFKWELPALRNPLFKPPESDARALGTLVHCAVLEGMAVFDQRYFKEPALDDDDPRVIRTADHAKAWLKDNGAKQTGLKADLFDRIRACAEQMRLGGADEDELPLILDDYIARLGQGREMIKSRSYDYVRLVEQTVRSCPEACALLSNGLPEISIFWTENGVRYKARLDWISAAAVIDVKKFGQPPRRGISLHTQLHRDVVAYSYDVQAVHNVRAAMQLPLLFDGGGEIIDQGPGATGRINQLEEIARRILDTPPTFHWLFLRTPGPPQVFCLEFPAETRRWDHAQYEIETAIGNLGDYRRRCGHELDPDKPWIDVGAAVWDDDALPEYMWDVAQ